MATTKKSSTSTADGIEAEEVKVGAEQVTETEEVKVGTEQATETKEVKPESKKVKEKKIVPKDIDPNQIVTVVNGFQGALVYKSPRTNEVYKWDTFGDEQEMELRELRNAKSSAKSFFINNWFMFNDEDKWVIDYLGVANYYKNAIKLEGFDDLFTKSPEEIKDTISSLSKGQRNSLAYKARLLVSEGKIDSLKVINAVEEALGIELIEK